MTILPKKRRRTAKHELDSGTLRSTLSRDNLQMSKAERNGYRIPRKPTLDEMDRKQR